MLRAGGRGEEGKGKEEGRERGRKGGNKTFSVKSL